MLPIILTIVFMGTNYETALPFYHMLCRKLSDFTMYFLDETFLKLNFPLTSWTGKYFYTFDILTVSTVNSRLFLRCTKMYVIKHI